MDDLISRKVAIEALGEEPLRWNNTIAEGQEWNDWKYHVNAIKSVPTVPAVPLDKLCEWLETDCILSCVSCEHLFGGQWCKQHPELPYRCHRKEHWKDALTKWMEELDGNE